MDDRNDGLDAWLHEKIEPLPPPPGTFELIKRRARHRRYRKLAASAATAVAVIVAIAVVPHVAPSVLRIGQSPPGSGVAVGHSGTRPPSGGGHTLKQSSAPAPPGTAPGRGSGGPLPVPPDFAATSVTFIGPETGWVIGQAGAPGQPCATSYCTSVARTDNAGQTWHGVPAPLAGPPDGPEGVSQIRFLDRSDGWAFGPELFATHDGGQHWTRIPTGGMRVISLETAGDRAFALFADCRGTGPDVAAGCTSVSLYSAAAGSDNWAPVDGPVTGLGDGGRDTSASLVLTATRGYLLAPDGTLYTGPVDGGPWQRAGAAPGAAGQPGTGGSSPAPGPSPGSRGSQGPAGAQGGTAPCVPGRAQPDGQPSGALLAAADASDLVLVCAGADGGSTGAPVFTSSDGGATWQRRGMAPAGGTATSLAAQPGGTVILATSQGIDSSADGGATWQRAAQGVQGGFGYVGMTSAVQGVAVPADASAHAIWFTFDGGQSWRRSAITGP
ncbi:MAG TPA: sialidase family protein [Streptosporangiaceae bacterium]|nr:sialidase family protein [Streptosporangiaceae bacterium]